MQKDWRRGRRMVVPAIVAAGLAVAASAYAVSVSIDNTNLTGGGNTTWDPDNSTYACTNPAVDGFVAVSDGSTTSPTRDDAFDDALALFIRQRWFRDPDGNGKKSGQQLKVGPRRTGGLKVSETERALQTSPTLRVLEKLKNTKDHPVRRTVNVETQLGSDTDTTIDASSNGNTTWSRADRWLVTHEEPFGATSDPVVTQVWYGKDAKKPFDVENTDGEIDCFLSKFRVRVPANKVRYLMFFLEMNKDSIADAVAKAAKFNNRHLTNKLRRGLSDRVEHRILNWDL
jgi:hypothetical protein